MHEQEYGGVQDEDEEYGQHEETKAAVPAQANAGGDLINYKGIYFNDEPGQKQTDPETGAHFRFRDMCRRL